jgi:hypothetical protein
MMGLEFSLSDALNVAIGVLAGGVITAIVAWIFFRWTSEQTMSMLRTLGHFLEQLGADFGLETTFHRDAGQIDLAGPGVVRRVTVPKAGAVAGEHFEAELRSPESPEDRLDDDGPA